MEKYIDMKSPLTGGRVKEVSTTEEKEFRKEKFLVHVRYCVCEDTGEQFTTTRQDTLQFNDLYAQYRVKHGIPFPEEIIALRKRYGLNYSQISRLLGFGVNQYAKYEKGEVPSESNGKMIAAIRDKNVILGMLQGCREAFSDSEYEKIKRAIMASDERKEEYSPLHEVVYGGLRRCILNGYGYQSIPKLFDMVGYIVSRHGEVFPTKLNKLMFYADFCHYRETGMSISGLQYKALNFGPVPDHYATIYDNVPGLSKRLVEAHDMISTLLSCSSGNQFPHLIPDEKATIDHVVEKLKPLSVSEIIEASHTESGWQSCSVTRSSIPYSEAHALRLERLPATD